jgi:phage recombination protein Bet
MTTDLVPANGRAVPPAPDATADRERLDLLKKNYAPKASDLELALYADVSEKLGLLPQAKQIYAVSRWNKRDGRYEMTIQISIDGYRLIAQRSGQYAGTDAPLWCGADGQWTDVWLSTEPPEAARVLVWRKDAPRPTVGQVMRREFKQDTKFWADMPANQLAIAAERQALRKAFQVDVAAAEAALQDCPVIYEELPDPDDAPTATTLPQLAAPAPPTQASPRDHDAAPGPSDSRVLEGARGGGAPAPPAVEEEPAEKPEVTGFYDVCRDQLHLDRAAAKRLLGVGDADDSAALRTALTKFGLPQTRKGLGLLGAKAAELHAASLAADAPLDDEPDEPEEYSPAVQALRDDLDAAAAEPAAF